MTSTITIDLNDFDHIPEKSSYNRNYYRLKDSESSSVCASEIFVKSHDDGDNYFYLVAENGNHKFLFCDSYNPDTNVYSGDLFHWWS